MFEIKKIDENLIMLEGRFDASQIESAETLLSCITNSFTVDMTNLEYISSAGLGLLLRTLTRLRGNGNNLVLRNMNKHISEVLKYSGLNKIFTIEEKQKL